MEVKINKIKGYLLDPQKIADDNVSLFVELQTLLYKRESNSNKYAEYDRELYDLFHLICSFYLQRIRGVNAWRRKDTAETLFSYEVDKHGNHINDEDRIKEAELLWGVKFGAEKTTAPIIPPNINAELVEGWITAWRSSEVINKPMFGTLDEIELMCKDVRLLWHEYNSLPASIYIMSAEDEKRHKCSLLKLIFNSYQRIGFRFTDRVEYVVWIEQVSQNKPLSAVSTSTETENTTLPKQLKPKCIKTPIQRDKLYDLLHKNSLIAETTSKDCFNWAMGSEVQPKQWKPIRWMLKNTKGKNAGQSHSSALRELLLLLIYDTVYTSKCTPQNLKKTEKLIAQNLFVGFEGETLILSNAKQSENKSTETNKNKGYTSEYENLINYIHWAKNAK